MLLECLIADYSAPSPKVKFIDNEYLMIYNSKQLLCNLKSRQISVADAGPVRMYARPTQ
jgi:hypothetical protein